MSDTKFLPYKGEKIAYCYDKPSKQPITLMFLPGFFSTMKKTKPLYVRELCQQNGWGFLSLDYFGHGESSGNFKEGKISRWIEDCQAVIQHTQAKNLIVIGSSMGGWIMLHLSLRLASIIKGLVGIAVAPDFTQYISSKLTEVQLDELKTYGKFTLPSGYSAAGVIISQSLLSDGEPLLLLNQEEEIKITVPIRLLHGLKDLDAPYHWSELVMKGVASNDVRVTYIKDGLHSLSSSPDLRLLRYTLLNLVEDLSEEGIL